MRHITIPGSLLCGLVLAGLSFSVARAQDPPKPAPEAAKTVKRVPVHPSTAIAGKDLYREYCAVCHGTAGKGDGPAADALKTAPPDLTQIASKNGGKYPEMKVQHIITGESEEPSAHGSKDMPMWGTIFHHMGTGGNVRVYNLVKYIEEMQAK
jgi:mono/diheme cytochrome c family protein